MYYVKKVSSMIIKCNQNNLIVNTQKKILNKIFVGDIMHKL